MGLPSEVEPIIPDAPRGVQCGPRILGSSRVNGGTQSVGGRGAQVLCPLGIAYPCAEPRPMRGPDWLLFPAVNIDDRLLAR